MTTTLGVSALGVRPLGGNWPRATPTVTITSPSGVVTTATLAFTYSSPVSRTQAWYQYQIRTADGSAVLDDSGMVLSSSNSGISIPFLFSGGSTYQVWVRASDGFDASGWSVSTITTDLVDVNDFLTEAGVGSIYEIGINGRGYMLRDDPQTPVQRRSTVLEAPRFATGNTPFTEAVERYSFVGGADFSGGAGQRFYDREDSDRTRYWRSEGVNPFDGSVKLLPSTTEISGVTNSATPYLTVADNKLCIVAEDDTAMVKTITNVGDSPSNVTLSSALPPQSFASDGLYWYWADGGDIYRSTDALNPWSSLNAKLVRWVGDRIATTYVDGSSRIVVSTLDSAGAEEVAGGRFKYPSTSAIPDITGGDGYMWFIVNRGSTSQVHYWKIGSADTYAAIGLQLPAGQIAQALGYYLGNVFVRAVERLSSSTQRVIIYRCVPSNGVLTPERLLDWEDASGTTYGEFAGDDRFVYFTWSSMNTGDVSGVGCIDLSTGGWAKWVAGGVGKVRSVVVWNGRIVYSVDGDGVFLEDTVRVASGWLETSLADQGSSLTKVFDGVVVSMDPLPSNTTVAVAYSTNDGVSYTTVGTGSTVGQSVLAYALGSEGRSISVKVTLTSTGANTPEVRTVQTKLHPTSIVDQVVTFPINLADQLNGLNGQPLPVNGPGAGLKRLRSLENLIGTRVKLQDVDWPVTGVSTVWDLVDVRATTNGVFDPKQARRVDSGVAEVTLRRGS